MADQLSKVRARARRLYRRLSENLLDPCNADCALWGQLAVLAFADVTGNSQEVQIDPETVLGDLLAGLMHWCDTQQTSTNRVESIDFESALERARNHYNEECAAELEANG